MMFPPLVQAKLDEFCRWWSQHRVRHQADNMPSRHVPINVLETQNYTVGLTAVFAFLLQFSRSCAII